MECGEKKFLYEVDSPGSLYLTIDHNKPIFVSFHQHIRLEVCLMKEGQEQSQLLLDPVTPQQDGRIMVIKEELDSGVRAVLEGNILETEAGQGEETLSTSLNEDEHYCAPKPRKKIMSASVVSNLRTKPKKLNHASLSSLKSAKVETSKRKAGKSKKFTNNDESVTAQNLMSREDGTALKTSEFQADDVECTVDNGTTDVENSSVADDIDGQKDFSCPFCFKSFRTKLELIQHTKVVKMKPYKYKCDKCRSRFPFKAYLLAHAKNHRQDISKDKLYVCEVCGEDAKTNSDLKRHMFKHTGEYIYQCCLCEKQEVKRPAFARHQANHLKGSTVHCNCCGENFPDRAALCSHKMARMHVKCSVCNQEFPNRTSRNIHMKTEHGDQMVRCKLCSHPQLFSPSDLAEHMEKHKRHKKKQCGICGLFVSRLDKHRLTHVKRDITQAPENRPFMCDLCPKRFRRKDTLTQHRESHNQERSHKCHLCPKAFTCRSVLRKHYKTHSGLMPFECEICGKRCLERSNLRTHMRVHSKTKVFQCQLCSQGFNYKSSLDGHMRSKHSAGTSNDEAVVRPTSSTSTIPPPVAGIALFTAEPEYVGMENDQLSSFHGGFFFSAT